MNAFCLSYCLRLSCLSQYAVLYMQKQLYKQIAVEFLNLHSLQQISEYIFFFFFNGFVLHNLVSQCSVVVIYHAIMCQILLVNVDR